MREKGGGGSFFLGNGVGEGTDLFDLNGDRISRFQKHRRFTGGADAVRGAGHDDASGQERGAAAEVGNQGRHIKSHVVGVRVLDDGAVELRPDAERIGVGDLVGRDEARPQRREGVEELAAAPLAAAPDARSKLSAALQDVVDGRASTSSTIRGAADASRVRARVSALL